MLGSIPHLCHECVSQCLCPFHHHLLVTNSQLMMPPSRILIKSKLSKFVILVLHEGVPASSPQQNGSHHNQSLTRILPILSPPPSTATTTLPYHDGCKGQPMESRTSHLLSVSPLPSLVVLLLLSRYHHRKKHGWRPV